MRKQITIGSIVLATAGAATAAAVVIANKESNTKQLNNKEKNTQNVLDINKEETTTQVIDKAEANEMVGDQPRRGDVQPTTVFMYTEADKVVVATEDIIKWYEAKFGHIYNLNSETYSESGKHHQAAIIRQMKKHILELEEQLRAKTSLSEVYKTATKSKTVNRILALDLMWEGMKIYEAKKVNDKNTPLPVLSLEEDWNERLSIEDKKDIYRIIFSAYYSDVLRLSTSMEVSDNIRYVEGRSVLDAKNEFMEVFKTVRESHKIAKTEDDINKLVAKLGTHKGLNEKIQKILEVRAKVAEFNSYLEKITDEIDATHLQDPNMVNVVRIGNVLYDNKGNVLYTIPMPENQDWKVNIEMKLDRKTRLTSYWVTVYDKELAYKKQIKINWGYYSPKRMTLWEFFWRRQHAALETIDAIQFAKPNTPNPTELEVANRREMHERFRSNIYRDVSRSLNMKTLEDNLAVADTNKANAIFTEGLADLYKISALKRGEHQ